MNAFMRELVRMTLARSLYLAAAFAATLVACDLVGQAPERSVGNWILLASVLGLLAFLAGLSASYFEMRQR